MINNYNTNDLFICGSNVKSVKLKEVDFKAFISI